MSVEWKVKQLREALAELVVRVTEEPGDSGALEEAVAAAGRVLRVTSEAHGAPEMQARERLPHESL